MAKINGNDFIALLERCCMRQGSADADRSGDDPRLSRLRIPTGPWDPVDLERPSDMTLEVSDSVDLLGRKFPNSVHMYGVRFRGRVDMRDVTVDGSADLTGCVFEEGLRLDDAEIKGSLRLARISVDGLLSLNGIIIHGRLDLSGSRSDGDIRLLGADVDGFVDLRAVSAQRALLKGAHIRSDLKIGCGRRGRKQPSKLRTVDAVGCRIGGRVDIEGAGTGQRPIDRALPHAHAFGWRADIDAGVDGPELDFSHAQIDGTLQIAPFGSSSPRGDTAARQHDWARAIFFPSLPADADPLWPVVRQLRLLGATIRGDLVLAGALLLEGLDAAAVQVDGNVALMAGAFACSGEGAPPPYVRQTEIRTGLYHCRALQMTAAKVRGSVTAQGVCLRPSVDLSSVEVSGAFDLGGFAWPYTPADEPASVVGTTIEGDLLLYLAELHNAVELRGLSVGGEAAMWGLKSAAYIRWAPQYDIRGRIGKDINLHSARFAQLDLEGVEVTGEVRLQSVEAGRIRVGPGRLQPFRKQASGTALPAEGGFLPDADAVYLTQLGAWSMFNSKVRADVMLDFVQITGQEVGTRRGVSIEDCEVGGGISFFSEMALVGLYLSGTQTHAQALAQCPVHYADYSASVVGNLRIKRCHVRGDIDLRGIKVDGRIDLEDSSFGGDINVSAVWRKTNGNPDAISASPVPHAAHAQNRAVCGGLDLRMARCSNDVDLTGLTVHAEQSADPKAGTVDARYVSVTGDLLAYDGPRKDGAPQATASSDREAHAVVATGLNLSYAKLSHLVVSALNFPPEPGAGAAPRVERGLQLERSNVGKFEVREVGDLPLAEGGRIAMRGHRAYPIPIRLTDVVIEVWDIEGTEDCGNADADKYINLLANDNPFRRSTYRSLENSLRNSGDDEHADFLYRAMKGREWELSAQKSRSLQALAATRRRLDGRLGRGAGGPAGVPQASRWRTEASFLRRAAAHHLFRRLLSYGTDPTKLLLVVLFLFLVSMPVYLSPTNFSTSLQYLAAPTGRFAAGDVPPAHEQTPPPSRWGAWDGLQIALKNHLPIVPLSARDEWQARDTRPTVYSLDGGTCDVSDAHRSTFTVCLPFAPEDYFNAMQLLNWVCWPILLTFFIRRLLRQS